MFNLSAFVSSLATLTMEEAEQALQGQAVKAGECSPAEFGLFQAEAFRRRHMWAVDATLASFPAWAGEDYRLWAGAVARLAEDQGETVPSLGLPLVHRTCTHRTVYGVLEGGVLVIVRATPHKGWLNDVVGGSTVQAVVAVRSDKVVAFAGALASEAWMDRLEAAIAADRAADEASIDSGTWEAYHRTCAEQDGLSEGDCPSLGLSWEAVVAFQAQQVRRKANIKRARSARTAYAQQEAILREVLGRPMPQARR